MPRSNQAAKKKNKTPAKATAVLPPPPTAILPATTEDMEPPPTAATAAVGSTTDFVPVAPPTFAGRPNDDPFAFVRAFERYVDWKAIKEDDRKRALFAVLLRDDAAAWFDTLTATIQQSYDALQQAFKHRYLATDAVQHRHARDLFTRKQADGETVDDFIASVRRQALMIGATDDVVRWILLCGFKPHIAAVVTQQKAVNIDQIIEAARLAEITQLPPATPPNDALILQQLSDLRAEVHQLGRDRVTSIRPPRDATPERHVAFLDDVERASSHERRQPFIRRSNRPPSPRPQFSQPSASSSLPPANRYTVNLPPPQQTGQGGQLRNNNEAAGAIFCSRCARGNCNGSRGVCTAYGKQCFNCFKLNHVARACRAAQIVHPRSNFQY